MRYFILWYASLSELLPLCPLPCVQLETLLKLFPMLAYRNLALQCLTEVRNLISSHLISSHLIPLIPVMDHQDQLTEPDWVPNRYKYSYSWSHLMSYGLRVSGWVTSRELQGTGHRLPVICYWIWVTGEGVWINYGLWDAGGKPELRRFLPTPLREALLYLHDPTTGNRTRPSLPSPTTTLQPDRYYGIRKEGYQPGGEHSFPVGADVARVGMPGGAP